MSTAHLSTTPSPFLSRRFSIFTSSGSSVSCTPLSVSHRSVSFAMRLRGLSLSIPRYCETRVVAHSPGKRSFPFLCSSKRVLAHPMGSTFAASKKLSSYSSTPRVNFTFALETPGKRRSPYALILRNASCSSVCAPTCKSTVSTEIAVVFIFLCFLKWGTMPRFWCTEYGLLLSKRHCSVR